MDSASSEGRATPSCFAGFMMEIRAGFLYIFPWCEKKCYSSCREWVRRFIELTKDYTGVKFIYRYGLLRTQFVLDTEALIYAGCRSVYRPNASATFSAENSLNSTFAAYLMRGRIALWTSFLCMSANSSEYSSAAEGCCSQHNY